MKYLPFLAASLITAVPATAEETRQVDAHEHGVSTVELAIEDGTVEMNITSPGADIVGFEYAASTTADKDAVEAAIRMMLTPENIVILPTAAECRLTEVLAHLHGEDHEGHEDHAEGEDHADDHGHSEEEEHSEDHGHADGEEHAEGEAHDHGEAEHSEFHVRYKYDCEHTDDLTQIDFPFFDAFENAQEIEASYITSAGAGSAELDRDAPTLDLGTLQ